MRAAISPAPCAVMPTTAPTGPMPPGATRSLCCVISSHRYCATLVPGVTCAFWISAPFGVRRQHDREQRAARLLHALEERRERAEAEIRMHRDGVGVHRAVRTEQRAGVRGVGRADVAALDVEQGQAAERVDRTDDVGEHLEPGRAETLEVRRLRLDHRHLLRRGVDHAVAEIAQAPDVIGQAPGHEQLRARVETEAERAALGTQRGEAWSEGGGARRAHASAT